jgi:undecaprenyl-diphosphatase
MPRTRRSILKIFARTALFLAILSALILGVLVYTHPVLGIDVKISHALQGTSLRLLPLMRFVSFFGIEAVAFPITLISSALFFLFKRRREAVFTLATIIADVLTVFIKLAIHRPRPTELLVTVSQKLTDPSFPSGHVVHYVVFFGFLIAAMFTLKDLPKLLRVSVISASIILIILVSISRLYLGAHWASDVIGGYLVGFIFLAMLLSLYRKQSV